MHNLKEIRLDFAQFEKSLEKRFLKIDFNNLKKLDYLNRSLIQKKESLEKEKKDISKSKDETLFKKSKEISIELESVSENQKKVKDELQKLGLGRIIFENTGNIGKSYRKHDEIGTPICITIDFDSLEDESITVRDRDSMDQSRMSIKDISSFVIDKFKS